MAITRTEITRGPTLSMTTVVGATTYGVRGFGRGSTVGDRHQQRQGTNNLLQQPP